MPGVVSNPLPLPSACTIHSDAEYEVMVGRKTSRSGSNDRGIIFRRKASSSILTIRVQEALRALATTHRSKAIPRALGSVATHAHRMRYVTLEARKLPVGSGQVESAVRRVVNLRFTATGSFWTETTVSGLMHL